MKALLIYPQYPDTFWSFKHILKFISKKSAYPPLGLLTVASMLPEEWEKKLVDLNVSSLEDKDIEWADMILISAMLIQSDSAKKIIKRCKGKGKKIVAGGPAFTTQHGKFAGVDHFVLDEGEITIPMFLEDLQKGEAKPIYTSSQKPDINQTPIPDWSLINFNDYATMAVQYSRGCPFNCEFCDIIIMNGRVPRTKTPEKIIQEIQALYDAGWRESIFIVDDNFIGNKGKVKEMLRVLIEWQKINKYPFRLFTEASTDLADDEELMNMMSQANFYKVFVGIETPDVKSLHECGKVQNTTRDLVESVRIIQRHGMQVMGGFIVGFDSDKESIFDTQVKFIQQVGVVTAMVGMLIALPRTQLWHRLKKEGRLLEDSTGENTDGNINFEPKMGRDKLLTGYKKVLTRIYSNRNYYKRINTFIKNYKVTSKGRLSKSDIRAFLRSLWRIGIFSSASPYYWRLIFTIAFTKFKALPTAVELAITGLHFSKISKKISKKVKRETKKEKLRYKSDSAEPVSS